MLPINLAATVALGRTEYTDAACQSTVGANVQRYTTESVESARFIVRDA